jgi:hypothetical protein
MVLKPAQMCNHLAKLATRISLGILTLPTNSKILQEHGKKINGGT